jgi:hypothetical protein
MELVDRDFEAEPFDTWDSNVKGYIGQTSRPSLDFYDSIQPQEQAAVVDDDFYYIFPEDLVEQARNIDWDKVSHPISFPLPMKDVPRSLGWRWHTRAQQWPLTEEHKKQIEEILAKKMSLDSL